MENFLDEVGKIISILRKEKKDGIIKQIENGMLLGGTSGEFFDIICTILKTYEISNPSLFYLIRKPAEELFEYAKTLGREPLANFGLLEELSK